MCSCEEFWGALLLFILYSQTQVTCASCAEYFAGVLCISMLVQSGQKPQLLRAPPLTQSTLSACCESAPQDALVPVTSRLDFMIGLEPQTLNALVFFLWTDMILYGLCSEA